MAGGPVLPFSAVPDSSGQVFDKIFDGSGTYWDLQHGMGLVDGTTLSADRSWYLWFKVPPSISGTAKVEIAGRCNVSSGNVIVNPKWAGIAASGEDPSSINVSAEGNQTFNFTGNQREFVTTKVTLDADTGGVNAGEWIKMELVFVDSGTTVAQESVWFCQLIWE